MIKKVLGWTANTVLLILATLVILSGFSMLEAKKHPGEIPTVMGYSSMSVLTGSMRPMLKPGDMIITKAVKPYKIKTGDIITYKVSKDILVTHRVKEIVQRDAQRMFLTKGDANNVDDHKLVTADQLIGTLAFKIPYGGYISKFARSPVGFILLVVFPVGLIIISEIRTIFFEWGKEDRKGIIHKKRVEI